MPSDPNPEPDQLDSRLTAVLLDLLEIGAKVAQNVGRQAESQTESTDLAEQFERVSRAMRRTVLLIRHIAQPGPTAHPGANPAHRTQARKRIIREVEDAIQREAENATEADPLHAELRERLDSPDLDEEIAHRPIQDIIIDIRRDLGLENPFGAHPWQRRTPRDIETLRLRAAAPRPPGPYLPGPEAPRAHRPPRDPDRELQKLVELAKTLSGT